jgi:small-conductance mechanosensitive channel
MKKLIAIFYFLIISNIIIGQEQSDKIILNENNASLKVEEIIKVPIIFKSDTLFTLKSRSNNYPVQLRSKDINNRINSFGLKFNKVIDSLYLKNNEEYVEVMVNEDMLFAVTNLDAKFENTSLENLAKVRLKSIEDSFTREEMITPMGWLKSIGFFILSLLVLYGLIKLINLMFEKINLRLSRIERKFLSRKGNLLRYFLPGNSNNIFVFLVNVLRIIIIVFILFICIPISFSFFHFSGNLVQKFYSYIEEPIKYVFMGIINFIPSLFFMIVIGMTARYFVRVINVITTDIENGKLEMKNFHKDWAKPTGKLLGLLIYALALVLIFPYLPGSGSSAFQGVSIFIGAIISFGSTSAISNIIAGIVITYMRPFQIGDRVKIDNIVGDVIDKTILVTHLRTTKNEEVTIPNANILIGNIINYSSRDVGNIIVHTTVTLGYDVAWEKANELLIAAANRAPFIFKDPAPFVLQTSLDDFYVSYELNAYTKEFKKLPFIYSEIHKNILDVFDEAGIEILSPGYTAARDGSITTVPSKVNSEGKGPFSQLINHLTGRNQTNTIKKNNTTEES